MTRFALMDKSQREYWLPMLFDLLYENMQEIAPDKRSREQAKKLWLGEVSPALNKAPRQILLCFVDDALAGYIQYYTNGNLLMIEELQIAKPYQRTTVFYGFCKHFSGIIPEEIQRVEAYADPRNLHSKKLMAKLGMTEKEEGRFIHLSGSVETIRGWFK